MARASTRAALRRLRQERNKASLSPEQKKNEKAAEQFIVFGGRRGSRTNSRSFESFVAQHG